MSALEIFDCEQGSDDWFRVRLGMPTASEFSTVLASGKGGGVSITRRTYLDKLAAERITGRPTTTYTNRFMERGSAMEGEVRDYYTMLTDTNPQRVGFIKNEKKGCSPDALIDANGMLEIKTAEQHIMIRVFDNDCVPTDHIPQLQGNLWVAEREWIDLIIYCPGMKAFIRRVHRDESYIARLAAAVNQFNNELDALTERVRSLQ